MQVFIILNNGYKHVAIKGYLGLCSFMNWVLLYIGMLQVTISLYYYYYYLSSPFGSFVCMCFFLSVHKGDSIFDAIIQRNCCIFRRTLMPSCFYHGYTAIQVLLIWRLVRLHWKLILKVVPSRESSWLRTILTALSLAKPQSMVCTSFCMYSNPSLTI